MYKWTWIGVLFGFVIAAGQVGAAEHERALTHERGVHVLREHQGGAATGASTSGSPVMTSHGGIILAQTAVRLVYAGPGWAQPSFVGDKISGLDTFFAGFGGSTYAATAQEYVGSNGSMGPAVAYQGHGSPIGQSLDGEDIQSVANAACAEYGSQLAAMPNAGSELIMIISDKKRASSAYCGYHSAATCDNGQMIQFGFVWNLDDDPSCNPQDSTTGHSQGLAALANVIAHEVQETRSDPHLDGWFDAVNSEIGDKCAWSFGGSPVTLSNGSRWKLQGEWSNSAFNAGTGFHNGAQQPGCIDHVASASTPAPVTVPPAAKAAMSVNNSVRCPNSVIGKVVSCSGSITVTAVGAALTLGATPVTVSGQAGEFSMALGSCTAKKTIANGSSCTFGAVSFRPTGTGARKATVTVAGGSSTAATTLAGAASGSALSVSSSAVRCGSAVTGRTVNCGTAGLRLTAVGGSVILAGNPLTIGDSAEFHVAAGSCTAGRVLAAGQGCTTGIVTFRPLSVGSKATSLVVATTQASGVVSVTGTGAAAAVARN